MMTDEQIIKAVGICRTPDTCRGCPYHELYTARCVSTLMKDVFELINRKDNEIKKLKKELDELEISADITETILEEKNADISELIFKERDNAVREFAERLKKYLCLDLREGISVITIDNIDNLVKEMTRSDDE